MKQSILINKLIIAILKNNTNIKAVVNANNILPVDAIEGTTFPFIIVKRNGIECEYTKDGCIKDTVQFQVIVASPKYADSVDIAQYVRQALEYRSFTFPAGQSDSIVTETTKIHNIFFTGISEDILNNTYIQLLQFEAVM